MVVNNEEEELLEEDTLASFDYYFNNFIPQKHTAELELVKAVLIMGVIDYLSTNRKEHFKDAREWFFDNENNDYVFSFGHVCELMEINPDVFRKRIKKLKRTKAKFALDGKRINGSDI